MDVCCYLIYVVKILATCKIILLFCVFQTHVCSTDMGVPQTWVFHRHGCYTHMCVPQTLEFHRQRCSTNMCIPRTYAFTDMCVPQTCVFHRHGNLTDKGVPQTLSLVLEKNRCLQWPRADKKNHIKNQNLKYIFFWQIPFLAFSDIIVILFLPHVCLVSKH